MPTATDPFLLRLVLFVLFFLLRSPNLSGLWTTTGNYSSHRIAPRLQSLSWQSSVLEQANRPRTWKPPPGPVGGGRGGYAPVRVPRRATSEIPSPIPPITQEHGAKEGCPNTPTLFQPLLTSRWQRLRSCPIPLASTRPKPNLTRTGPEPGLHLVGSLPTLLSWPSAALPRACQSYPISPVAHPPLHLPVSLSGVAQPYASGRGRKGPPPPGHNRHGGGGHGRIECNHRCIRGPLTLAINPKQTHQCHCAQLRDSPACLPVIFYLWPGAPPAGNSCSTAIALPASQPAQTSACKFLPNFRGNPWPRLSLPIKRRKLRKSCSSG